jgi:hypothetical protein
MRSLLATWRRRSADLWAPAAETDALSLMEMYARGGGGGVSLSVNKRLASEKTRKILSWTPTRYDILEDTEHGSYAV